MSTRLRLWLRLIAAHRRARMLRLLVRKDTASILVANVVHRFEESIAGRPYLIEVAAVSPDRWRAYIVQPRSADRAHAVLRPDARRSGGTADRVAESRLSTRRG